MLFDKQILHAQQPIFTTYTVMFIHEGYCVRNIHIHLPCRSFNNSDNKIRICSKLSVRLAPNIQFTPLPLIITINWWHSTTQFSYYFNYTNKPKINRGNSWPYWYTSIYTRQCLYWKYVVCNYRYLNFSYFLYIKNYTYLSITILFISHLLLCGALKFTDDFLLI